MKISLIFAHPNIESFNAAIARAVFDKLTKNGHVVNYHDLYREKFDPLITCQEFSKEAELNSQIQIHCDEIANADGIVIVHPNWWGQPPAILKGWVDRVIRGGVAYRFEEHDSGEGVPVGLLKAKTAVVLNTSDTSREREEKVFGDPLERIWKDCVFGLCGVENFYRKMFRIVVTSTLEERKIWLGETEKIVDRYFPKD
jgi:NAD(P)H dehydrogenase (quinone)